MKLRHKLLMAPVLTAGGLLISGQIDSFFTAAATKKVHSSFVSEQRMTKLINAAHNNFGEIHTGVYRNMSIIGSLDDSKIKALRQDLSARLNAVDGVLTSLSSGGANHSMVESLRGQVKQYAKQADSALDLASIDPNTGVAALQGADGTFQNLTKTFENMESDLSVRFLEQTTSAQSNADRLHMMLVMFQFAVAAVALWASWIALRKVANDLSRAGGIAQQVAAGNLAVSTDTSRDDELGDLLRALGQMQGSLLKVVGEIRGASDHIGVSSTQIASGTQDLANRTESAAANLEQTSSSMQELTSTVRQSAEAARNANETAAAAADVARKGGEVVSQVVTTMEVINDSSRKIANIIGVIDGIAFQTNILALNAAVEAARAGEAGRGFAVVASEVRSLAGRSAQAAKEIKDLINASVENVDSGSQLVQSAGETMSEIVMGVQRVTDALGEIAARATEQSDGIAQVNQAVTQLDQMTQQNASLVEESSAAAESMRDQAKRLSELVSVFNIGGMHVQKIAPPPVVSAAKVMPRPVTPKPALPHRKSAFTAASTPVRPSLASTKKPVPPSGDLSQNQKRIQTPPVAAKPSSPAQPSSASRQVAVVNANDDDWETF